jgi:hypothetical protein
VTAQGNTVTAEKVIPVLSLSSSAVSASVRALSVITGSARRTLMGPDHWKVFWTALGSHRYGVADLAKLAAAAAAAAYLYWYGREMSLVDIALTVLFVVFVLFFWVVLDYAVKLTKQIRDARLRIAELRVSGVELRNYALNRVATDGAFEEWRLRVNDWTNEVQDELGKISKSDAVWFSV